jgi:hypothetical protein
MDDVIGKHNATILSLFQNPCPKKDMYVAVDVADVAFRPPCNFANGHCPWPRFRRAVSAAD